MKKQTETDRHAKPRAGPCSNARSVRDRSGAGTDRRNFSREAIRIHKKDLILILAIVAAAVVVLLIVSGQNDRKQSERALIVTVDGKEYTRSPLKDGETILVRQENGCENVIRMTANGFYMESANCSNHDCIAQGEVTTENWKQRKLLEQIICLPNRVTVSLELTEAEAADPDVPDF